jgi:hypothetical protein
MNANMCSLLWQVCGERHAVIWFENLNGRDNSEDLGVDGRILECIVGKEIRKMRAVV